MNANQNELDVSRMQQIKQLILEHTPTDKVSAVNSTLSSFAFLKQHSQRLATLPDATSDAIVGRIKHIFENLDSIETPDCPEVEGECVPEMIMFQKINRTLFIALDDSLQRDFDGANQDYEFAFPVIEWAENVIKELTFDNIRKSPGANFEAQTIHLIESKYNQKELQKYFEEGWELVEKDDCIINNSPANIPILAGKLRCTMCYPARASILKPY